jgi:hypothetical protein
MTICRYTAALGAFILLSTSLLANTLTFVAQLDPDTGATNNAWFNPFNWFTTDSSGNLVSAGRAPQSSETTIITGLADASATGVRVQTLILTNNAEITNGTFAVEALQMLSGSSFQNATINVLSSLAVGGTNCTLNGTKLSILSTAAATFSPVAPATASTLMLVQGALILNSGQISLNDRSQITGGGGTLMLEPGAVLSSTNLTAVQGSATNHLVIDNSGLIRVDGGELLFGDGIDWQSSAGSGEFRAVTAAALGLFAGALQVPSGVTSLFSGLMGFYG